MGEGNADLIRELEKALDVLRACARHFNAEAEMNAALHMSEAVRPNPLTAAVNTAIAGGEQALARYQGKASRPYWADAYEKMTGRDWDDAGEWPEELGPPPPPPGKGQPQVG